jgi:hypothetical protein
MDQAVAEPAKSQHGIMSFRSFWMYNALSIVIFHFSWKMQSDVWGTVNGGSVSHITGETLRKARIRSMAGFGIFSGRSHRR